MGQFLLSVHGDGCVVNDHGDFFESRGEFADISCHLGPSVRFTVLMMRGCGCSCDCRAPRVSPCPVGAKLHGPICRRTLLSLFGPPRRLGRPASIRAGCHMEGPVPPELDEHRISECGGRRKASRRRILPGYHRRCVGSRDVLCPRGLRNCVIL